MMIAQAKKLSPIVLAVLTCGALLFDPQVHQKLTLADVVLPSLNAVSPETFRAINRPHGRLNLAEMTKALERFRKDDRGQIWLKIMLVRGVNDNPMEITRLRKAIAEIKSDKVYLNTVIRPPVESDVMPLTEAALNALYAQNSRQADSRSRHQAF